MSGAIVLVYFYTCGASHKASLTFSSTWQSPWLWSQGKGTCGCISISWACRASHIAPLTFPSIWQRYQLWVWNPWQGMLVDVPLSPRPPSIFHQNRFLFCWIISPQYSLLTLSWPACLTDYPSMLLLFLLAHMIIPRLPGLLPPCLSSSFSDISKLC